MVALSKPVTDLRATHRPMSSLAVVTLFSLFGLVLSIALARYGIDIGAGL
ncbi:MULTISPECIES: hypothetical protein [Bradyrhizobium]